MIDPACWQMQVNIVGFKGSGVLTLNQNFLELQKKKKKMSLMLFTTQVIKSNLPPCSHPFPAYTERSTAVAALSPGSSGGCPLGCLN